MHITINGQRRELAEPMTVSSLLKELRIDTRRVAVELNRGILKRAASGLAGLSRQLIELGEVEIVMASEVPELALASGDELVVEETLSRSALTDSGERRI